ncbi:MAG: LysM peptidoglycan-binding domain-containing protein [Solirubrobacteraceae bacterium]
MDGVELREDVSTGSSEGSDPIGIPVGQFPALCPYLATIGGNWRSSSPAREHRCVAVTPPVPLALDKQRRLCLVADHADCSTYGAAVAARPSYAMATTPRGRVIARTTPIVLDQTRFDLRLPALRSDRVSGQGLLVGLLALAFAAILISRPATDGGAASGVGNGTPAPTTVAAASVTPRPSPKATTAPVVTARPVGSTGPVQSAQPSTGLTTPQPSTSGATYRVKSGDTLNAIAAHFGTTVKVLVELNNIRDPSKIHVGQVLKLP